MDNELELSAIPPAEVPVIYAKRQEFKTESVIRIIDSQADASEIWTEVAEVLQFRKSYLNSPHKIPKPASVVQAARYSAAGYYDAEIAEIFDMTHHGIANARHVVEKALFFAPKSKVLLHDLGLEMPPATAEEERLLAIYERLKLLPSLLHNEEETHTQLGALLRKNPHVEYIFSYLSTGRTIKELMADLGVTSLNNEVLAKQSSDLVSLALSGTTKFPLRRVARNVLIAKAAQTHERWDGISADSSFAEAIRCVTAAGDISKADPNYFYIHNVQAFIDMLVELHVDMAKSEGWQDTDYIATFPGINPRTHDPFSVNHGEYFSSQEYWFMDPLKEVWKAHVTHSMDPLIARLLPYSPRKADSLRTYVTAGIRFSEGVLLRKSRYNNSKWTDYAGNTSKEMMQILESLTIKCKELNTEEA